MSRKQLKPRKLKRTITPDPKYDSVLASRFINKLILGGKKSTAEKVFYDALEVIKEKTKQDPITVFNLALENVKPLLEVRPRRVGGATYQVPGEVSEKRSVALAIRWILGYATDKKGQPMANRLAQELLEASRKEGAAVKKREDTHKMAEANKAFAHYRW